MTPKPPSLHLVRIQCDPQAQLGHAVLLQQLEVWTQGHAESSRHVLRQPAVVGRVAQTAALVFTVEEEHLRKQGQTVTHLENVLSVRPHRSALYLCPADDFAIGFELGAMEDLDTGD